MTNREVARQHAIRMLGEAVNYYATPEICIPRDEFAAAIDAILAAVDARGERVDVTKAEHPNGEPTLGAVGTWDGTQALARILQDDMAERDVLRGELEAATASLETERRLGKYYVKARVYGAVAAEYGRTLQVFADQGQPLAKAALAWRFSDRNGVPMVAVEAIGELLDAARVNDQLRAELDAVRAAWDRERSGYDESCRVLNERSGRMLRVLEAARTVVEAARQRVVSGHADALSEAIAGYDAVAEKETGT